MLRRKNSLLIFKELLLCYKANFSVVLKNSVKSNISKYYFLSKYSRLFIWPLLDIIGLSNKSIQFKEQKQAFYISQVLQNYALWLGKYVCKNPMEAFSNVTHQNKLGKDYVKMLRFILLII